MLFLLIFSLLAEANVAFTVTASKMHVRESPGGKSLCMIPKGTKVTAAGRSDDKWIRVKLPALAGCPNEGFVAIKYLLIDGQLAPVKEAKGPAEPSDYLNPQKIDLIRTEAYDPTKEKGRGFAEFTSSFGLATFGNIFKATGLDVKGDIEEKLNMPQLERYFPNKKENRAIAKKIGTHVEKEILRGGLTNENVNEAILYAATTLVDIIIQRALEVEGVKDSNRRKLWAKRLLNPFHACMQKTRTYNEGSKCLESLQADLVNNLGLAIAYELSAQETGTAIAKTAPTQYRKCLNPQKKNADQRVQPCVLEVMRSSVAKFGVREVGKIAETKLPPAEVKLVTGLAEKSISRCLKKAVDRGGFLKCADTLTIEAGGELAYYSVLTNSQVIDLYPKENERVKLAESAKSNFHDCLKRENKRDSQGKIQTDACAQFVTMETTKNVANRLFSENLSNLGGITEKEQSAILDSISSKLNQCWNSAGSIDQNNTCLKSSVEALVMQVAKLKLEKELPADLLKTNPKLLNELLASVGSCLKNELPADILNSTDSASKVELCAGKLVKSSALRVAKHELDGVLEGKTTNDKAKTNLTESLVNQQFDSCLGNAPKQDRLSECSVELKTSAGVEIGKLLFAEEFDKYVKSRGGLEILGLNTETRKRYLDRLFLSHTECLKKNPNADKIDSADKVVDDCFKSSISNMATYLADITFQSKLRENLTDDKVIQELAPLFRAEFQQCLAEKNSESINNFIPQISVCGGRLTNKFTIEVAERELRLAIKNSLPNSTEKEKEITNSLLVNFKACIEATKPEDFNSRDLCAKDLKRAATLRIASESSKQEALRLLRVSTLPAQFSNLERELKQCLEKDFIAEFCARRHAQAVAVEIAKIKLRSSLADALGADYQNHEAMIKKLEASFLACVYAIPGEKPDAAFLKALKECGTNLEQEGISFAQEYLKTGLRNLASSEKEREIGDTLAEVLPCLEPIFPPGPSEDPAFRAIDPDGLFAKLTGAISEYIDLDLKKSEKDMDRILKEVFADMHATGTEESRRKLFDILVNGGMLDNLIRAIVISEAKKSMATLPKDDQLPKPLQDLLLDKTTIEKALNPEVMAKYRPFLAQKLLKPLLIEGKSMKDPSMKSALREMEKGLAEALLESHDFGQKLTEGMIQKSIDDKTSGTMSRWFFNTLGGYEYDWKKISATKDAQAAENYIKTQVIRPLVLGEPISSDEMKKRRKQASDLVEAALKNQ